MTESEALARIAALVQRHRGEQREPGRVSIPAGQIAEILAGVTPGAVPSQGIDRDELRDELRSIIGAPPSGAAPDAILALVRPVEGVTLTPEDVVTVLKWHDHGSLGSPEEDALAERLGAGS